MDNDSFFKGLLTGIAVSIAFWSLVQLIDVTVRHLHNVERCAENTSARK